jgi:hypothetical protein
MPRGFPGRVPAAGDARGDRVEARAEAEAAVAAGKRMGGGGARREGGEGGAAAAAVGRVRVICSWGVRWG